jgi:hypothetical protein
VCGRELLDQGDGRQLHKLIGSDLDVELRLKRDHEVHVVPRVPLGHVAEGEILLDPVRGNAEDLGDQRAPRAGSSARR